MARIAAPANAVKTAAAIGARIRGIHFTFASPAALEVLAALDLDFVYLDGEHGTFDWRDIETACIAAERHGLTAIARIPDASAATVTHFLDRGIRGIVVPHVESVEDAERVIEATYFGPVGLRFDGCLCPDWPSLLWGRPDVIRATGRADKKQQKDGAASTATTITPGLAQVP